jgi:hypothetical protein
VTFENSPLRLFGPVRRPPDRAKFETSGKILQVGGDAAMKKLGELIMTLDLHRLGVKIAVIAR